MSKFKVGDKVRDARDGEQGNVTKVEDDGNISKVWVFWESGDLKGQTLWVYDGTLELIEQLPSEVKVIVIEYQGRKYKLMEE